MIPAPPAIVAQTTQLPPLAADVVAEVRGRIAGVPGAVVVIARRDGDAVRVDTIAGPAAPHADGDTLFEIGSVTKTFTGALLADAVRRGEVRYDEPLAELVPPGTTVPAYGGRAITLLDLAEQRSGLPPLPPGVFDAADPADPYAGTTDATLFGPLSTFTPARAPGAQYEYSNWGFALLGRVLALRARTGEGALLRARVFVPLGMTATTAGPERDAALIPAFDGDGAPQGPWHLSAYAGAGAIRSTANDLLRYVAAFDGDRGEAGAAVRTAAEPRVPFPGGRIGLAWMTAPDGTVWHNGGTGGYRTYLGVRPADRRAVVVLSNLDSPLGGDDVGAHLLDPADPLQHAPRAVALALDDATLARYPGRYQLAPGTVLTIARGANGLTAQLTGQGRHPIFASSPTSFFWRIVAATIDFSVDAAGRVSGATLHQNGADVPLTRLP